MTIIQGDRIALSRARPWLNAGPPRSGTSAGTAAGAAKPGDFLLDTTNRVAYVNEGSLASPYWTPVGYDQAGLFGAHTDFRDGAGAPLADATASRQLAGSGLRVFGQGIEVADSGLVVQAAGEGGQAGRITVTNEVAHTLAIGMPAGVMQPDQHGQLVLDVELTSVAAITLRSMFIGFLGLAADALDPPVTGAATTATLVQDDLAGLFMSVGLTDVDAFFGVHNKSNADATQDLAADGDTGPTNLAAAGTYQRFRVEIFSDGDMTAFIDKLEVYTQAIALDVDEECSPVVLLESTSTATKSADIRRVAMWANR